MLDCLATVLNVLITFLCVPPITFATNRYYGTYLSYGSGDTIIQTFHAHSGSASPHRKWHVECLDGEAVVGIQDWVNDFQKIEAVWCKFSFPYKPPSNGLYPYFPECFARNYTAQFFCFNPQYLTLTVNSFITGFWDNDLQFLVFRPGADDTNLYKCCKAPPGYFIDYASCYYMPTHDQYWEFYDSLQHIITYCASGYVMTGLSKKTCPYDKEWHIDWIQCCRIGFGGAGNFKPATRITRSVDDEDEEEAGYYLDAMASIQEPGGNYSAFFKTISTQALDQTAEFRSIISNSLELDGRLS